MIILTFFLNFYNILFIVIIKYLFIYLSSGQNIISSSGPTVLNVTNSSSEENITSSSSPSGQNVTNLSSGQNVTNSSSALNVTKLSENVTNFLTMVDFGECTEYLSPQESNITTYFQFNDFEFEDSWYFENYYWDHVFEDRFEKQLKDSQRHPLRVIIIPNYYNTNGWLKPYLKQFQSYAKVILNSVISSMIKYTEMTFVWSDISFLQLWWDQANLTQRSNFKKLTDSGRFEITNGGWVIPHETTVNLYPMVDQLIEGHQWLKTNLNIKPRVSLSLESFGYSTTFQYLLAALDFDGMVIQSNHYAWKQLFSKYQTGDFIWQTSWAISEKLERNLLTHNMPFNVYSSQHSCGPQADVCSKFDFNSAKKNFIDDSNVADKAQLLMKQYARTASLFPHNVALIFIGSGIRYRYEHEIEQQYVNFKKLIDYINKHRDYFSAKISFGTPKDYFREITKRNNDFPTLNGDFPMYSDVNKQRKRVYLSNRSYFKVLSNELEFNLRSSEILFTFAYNIVRQNNRTNAVEMLNKNYEKLILARRNLALLQHHSAITSTSPYYIIEDYCNRSSESLQDTVQLQELTIPMILDNTNIISIQSQQFKKLTTKRVISFEKDKKKFIVAFNSLAQRRVDLISFRSTMYNIVIVNDEKLPVNYQVNPIWNNTEEYEISFLVELLPLSFQIFQITASDLETVKKMTTIYCNNCNGNKKIFKIKNLRRGDIHLKNKKLDLIFNGTTGFLKSIRRVKIIDLTYSLIDFDAYSINELKERPLNFNFNFTSQYKKDVIISFGSIFSEIIVKYGPYFKHCIRIFYTNTYFDNIVHIENDIDVQKITEKKNYDLSMTIRTNIFNIYRIYESYYVDQNGFQLQPRYFSSAVNIEDNFYPITSSVVIQNRKTRVSLLTVHAQLAASLGIGRLQLIFNRRISYLNNTKIKNDINDLLQQHKVKLLIEQMDEDIYYNLNAPTLFSNFLTNCLKYPTNLYVIEDGDIELPINNKTNLSFTKNNNIPCNIHLMNIRTLTDNKIPTLPSRSALVLLHRQGYDCGLGQNLTFCLNTSLKASDLYFNNLQIENIKTTSLTGLNEKDPINSFQNISIKQMEIEAFKYTFEA